MATIADDTLLKQFIIASADFESTRLKAIETINKFLERYPDKSIIPVYVEETGYYKTTHNPDEWEDDYERGRIIGQVSALCELYNIVDKDLTHPEIPIIEEVIEEK